MVLPLHCWPREGEKLSNECRQRSAHSSTLWHLTVHTNFVDGRWCTSTSHLADTYLSVLTYDFSSAVAWDPLHGENLVCCTPVHNLEVTQNCVVWVRGFVHELCNVERSPISEEETGECAHPGTWKTAQKQQSGLSSPKNTYIRNLKISNFDQKWCF